MRSNVRVIVIDRDRDRECLVPLYGNGRHCYAAGHYLGLLNMLRLNYVSLVLFCIIGIIVSLRHDHR